MFTERVYGAAYPPEIHGRRWRVCARSACVAQPTRLRFVGGGGRCVHGARVWRSLLAWDSRAKVVGIGKWSAHAACGFSFPNTAQGAMRSTLQASGLHGFSLHRRQKREPITYNQ